MAGFFRNNTTKEYQIKKEMLELQTNLKFWLNQICVWAADGVDYAQEIQAALVIIAENKKRQRKLLADYGSKKA